MAVCFLTPIYTSSEKRPLISNHIKGPLVAAFRSPLMKALDRSVETLGLWIVTSSVVFIKSANQSSIKLCLILHLVAVWTLIYFIKVLSKCYQKLRIRITTSTLASVNVWDIGNVWTTYYIRTIEAHWKSRGHLPIGIGSKHTYTLASPWES